MVGDDRGWRGATQVEEEAAVDLSDPDLYASGDPHRVWRRLRETAPLRWNPEPDGPGFWAVTTYDLANAIYRQADAFSSAQGIVLREDRWAPDPAGGRMLALTDAPRHGKIRRIAAAALNPGTIARLDASSRSLAARLVEQALERGSCEFVDDVAARLPVAMTCDLMGVPREDWDHMYDLTRRAFGAGDPAYRTSGSARASAAQAHTEIMVYYRHLVTERRDRPRDDVVSALATGTVDGARLRVSEVLLHCDNLLVAGQETARHAITGGLLAFVDAPEQWRRLRHDETLMAPAVEEVLRWTSPGMHVLRTATRDVELAGQTIRAGDAVTVWNASANRDAAAFDHPDELDVGRSPNRHLALGVGSHYCLGASLVRLELMAMLAELRRSVRRVRIVGPVARLRSNLIAGFTSVPVALDAR
jgi:cytochrome P450